MNVVTYEEFNKLPKGTMFCPISSNHRIGEWEIKVSNPFKIGDSEKLFFNGVMSLSPWNLYDILDSVEGWEEPAEWESYDGDSNDYCDYPKFVILDKDDMKKLVEVLSWAINGCDGEIE